VSCVVVGTFHRWTGAGIFAGLISLAAPARAECPNSCEIAVDETVIDPPDGGCAHVRVVEDTCDCGIFLEVGNVCASPLVARDFTFDSCDTTPPQDDCASLEPDMLGRFHDSRGSEGSDELLLTLDGERGTETILVRSHVAELGTGGCGCSVVGQRGDLPGLWQLFLTVVSASLLRRRLLTR